MAFNINKLFYYHKLHMINKHKFVIFLAIFFFKYTYFTDIIRDVVFSHLTYTQFIQSNVDNNISKSLKLLCHFQTSYTFSLFSQNIYNNLTESLNFFLQFIILTVTYFTAETSANIIRALIFQSIFLNIFLSSINSTYSDNNKKQSNLIL